MNEHTHDPSDPCAQIPAMLERLGLLEESVEKLRRGTEPARLAEALAGRMAEAIAPRVSLIIGRKTRGRRYTG